MNWSIYDDKYAQTKIVETSNILDLKSFISDNKINCHVNIELVDPYFWSTDRSVCRGAVGQCGPPGATSGNWVDTRKIAEEKDISVKITFTTATTIAEQYKTHSLDLTKNIFGETYRTWRTQEIIKYSYYTCGVYKKPGFDAAFNAIKVLKPNCTEKQFASDFSEYDDWDSDLVDVRLYDKETDCISKFTKSEPIKNGKSIVVLIFLACDLVNNMNYIKTTLSTYK